MSTLKKFTVFSHKFKKDKDPKCFTKQNTCKNVNKQCEDCMMIQGKWTNYESA